MKSIKLKLMIIYLALVFIVMIVSNTFMLSRIKSQETNKYVGELKEFVKNIEEQVVQIYGEDKFSDILKKYYQYSIYEAYILDTSGETIASTTGDARRFKNSAFIASLGGLPKDGTGKDMSNTGAYKEWIYYAFPILDGQEEVVYVIFARTEAESMNSRLRDTSVTSLLTVALSLLLTGLLGFLFANTLTGPIVALTKKAKEIAQGNLDQEIQVYSSDEIGQLTDTFNEMARSLNELMNSIANEKNKMEIILHNMTDGILAYDRNGALLHANYASSELLAVDHVEAISFQDMMQILQSGITNLTDLAEEELPDVTVSLGAKFISSSFTPYKDEKKQIIGIVIVLRDITKHKKLDDMRKEFVANVSHEIRTPLTTIKSYSETLLDGAMEQPEIAKDFLSIIVSESDRMALLTKDLLELSKFDNKQLKMEFEPINLISVLKLSIRQNRVMAEEKEQKLIFEERHADFWIEGDAARMNQVFTNILSNAVKYSPKHSEIIIDTEETDRYYRIFIKDAGIGIPKEDIGRIFERFYRVDKARSRAMGGTGLGLSIAKGIVEAHGGKISAKSQPGKGTTMFLRFHKSDVGDWRDEWS